MEKKKMFALITAALLVVTAAGVLAHSTGEGSDRCQEMKELHEAIHGDDFEAHHQAMHGDDLEEHGHRGHDKGPAS